MDFNFNYTIRKICVKFKLIRNHYSKTKPMDTIFSPEKTKVKQKYKCDIVSGFGRILST